MTNFNFTIPLKKNVGDTLSGIASTNSIDRDGERMSNTALQMMTNDIKKLGINLFGNHTHEWENTLGVIKNAKLDANNQILIDIDLDDAATNPKIPMLLNKLKRGINLGLSVGGTVVGEKWEIDKGLNRKVHVLDEVKIYEVSVVGIPSNSDAFLALPQQIMKSMKKKVKLRKKKITLKTMTKCPMCFYDKNSKHLNIKKCPICYTEHSESKCPVCFKQ